MMSQYLRTSVRLALKKPLLPVLNLLGLSLGIACFLTISLYIYQENTYESAFQEADNIYRIEEHFLSMGELAWTTPNMPHALEEIPIVEAHTRVGAFNPGFKLYQNDRSFKLDHVLAADSLFFRIFDFQFLMGNPNEALNGPGKAVISAATAQQLFGRTDVVGETLKRGNGDDLLVSGVVQRPPLKSHLDFDMVFYQDRGRYVPNQWFGVGGYSYVKLSAENTVDQLNEALDLITEEKVYPFIYKSGLESENPMTYEEWSQSPNRVTFLAKPIRDIYLNSHLQFEIGPNGDRQTRVTLSIIGVFVLVIAVINFMNLSTSSASTRAKEVGVKKVLGAGKKRLVRQFLVQSVCFTLLAAVIGGGMSELFVRLINLQLGEVISVSLFSQMYLLGGIVLGMFLLGLLAGGYPAFYLSSVKSIPLLKGRSINQFMNVRSALMFRNGLVVFQFVISSALIAASVIVFEQMKHLQGLDLGYDKDRVIIIDNVNELGANKDAFKDLLLQNPNITNTSFTMRVPADGSNSTLSTLLDSETTVTFGQFIADEHLAETLGLELLAGEWFDANEQQYDSVVIINEAAVKAIGLEDPVGQLFGNYYRIRAVVKDFKFGGVREPIGPAVLFNTPKNFSRMAIRLNSESFELSSLDEHWAKFTDEPIEVSFLDQKYEQLLAKERQATDAVLVFTILAILIAALGLFGLATFSAEQRRQEFGIRRVLGANLNQLLGLFSLHFIKLISIAFIISIPIAYYALEQWLNGFASRIEVNALVFVIAGVLALLIAGVTLASQSLRVSRINPVETLRNE